MTANEIIEKARAIALEKHGMDHDSQTSFALGYLQESYDQLLAEKLALKSELATLHSSTK